MKLGVETVASKLPWVRLANTPMEVRLSLFISLALVAVVTLLEKPMGTFTVSVPVSFSQDVSVHAERIIKRVSFLIFSLFYLCVNFNLSVGVPGEGHSTLSGLMQYLIYIKITGNATPVVHFSRTYFYFLQRNSESVCVKFTSFHVIGR